MSSFNLSYKQTKRAIIKLHKCGGCGARELDKNGKCAYCGNNWFGEQHGYECDYCFSGQTADGFICTHCKGQGFIIV